MDKYPDLTVDDLAEEIFERISKCGPLDAAQIAIHRMYPLGIPEFDERFFGAIDSLEERGLIDWYPITEEYPDAQMEEGPYFYFSRVYHFPRPNDLKIVKKLTELVKKFRRVA